MNLLKRIYPDLEYRLLRGNIDTRIRKLLDDEYDAIVLARAGIDRLRPSLQDCRVIEMDPITFVPASCQGILTAEALKDSWAAKLLADLDDGQTKESFRIEREMMTLMQADCHDATISWFDEHAKPSERFKFTIERVGRESLEKAVKEAYNG